MWNRVGLKEDSKTLQRLNYWPFVLVAFIHAVVGGGVASRSGRASALGDWKYLISDDNYGYDSYGMLRELVSFILPFLGMALITMFGMWAVMVVPRSSQKSTGSPEASASMAPVSRAF